MTKSKLVKAFALLFLSMMVACNDKPDVTLNIPPPTPPTTPVANLAPVAISKEGISIVPGRATAILLEASDPENQTLTFEIVQYPIRGTLKGTAPDLVYTASAGYQGTDSLTFRVSDGLNTSEIATVSFSVLNHAPVAISAPILPSRPMGSNWRTRNFPTTVLSRSCTRNSTTDFESSAMGSSSMLLDLHLFKAT